MKKIALFLIICILFSSCSSPNSEKPQSTPQPPQNIYKKIAKEYASKIDYDNPIVRNFAVKLASKYPGERNIMQVQAIYEYVYRNWKYVNDPTQKEYRAKASETISNGLAGDCDDFAILMSALILAIGMSPRIAIHEDHAYPQLYIGSGDHCSEMIKYLSIKFRDTVYYFEDSKGKCWLSLDWTSWHIGGKPSSKKELVMVIYPDGNYVVYK